MGHNYTKYSQNFKKQETNKEVEMVKNMNEQVEKTMNNVVSTPAVLVEEVKPIEPLTGTVKGCKKLNVRKSDNKDADVLCIIDEMTEVKVFNPESTNEFYHVCTSSGVQGYCMKKYIDMK